MIIYNKGNYFDEEYDLNNYNINIYYTPSSQIYFNNEINTLKLKKYTAYKSDDYIISGWTKTAFSNIPVSVPADFFDFTNTTSSIIINLYPIWNPINYVAIFYFS